MGPVTGSDSGVYNDNQRRKEAVASSAQGVPAGETNEVKLNVALQRLGLVEKELDDLHAYVTSSDTESPMENCKATPLSLAVILNDGDSIIHNHVDRTIDKIQEIRRIICNG